MKIVEGLKKLRVIEKRMVDNTKKIQQYASILNTEKPAFDTEVIQKAEVNSLIQANKDLFKEYLDLKQKVEKTNLAVEMEVDGTKYTLSSLMIMRRKMNELMLNTYRSLNDTSAEGRIHRAYGSKDQQIHIVKMYDEKDKNKNLAFWQNLADNVDSRLEIINATTDLID